MTAANSSSQQKQQGLMEVHSTDLQGERAVVSRSCQQRTRLLVWWLRAGKGMSMATISKLTTCQPLMVPAFTQQHCARQGSCSL